ncbi:MAG: response regulator [Rhodospirillaceae bacterium]|nr:response regulator [Rhodospirillaceae bacterium]
MAHRKSSNHINRMPNILYIEDDEDLREAVIMALEDAGFTATGAENGMIGLESVRREQPDLVITDVLMPECDGIELIQALAREFPDLPVIAVTGGFKNALGGVPDNRDEIARAAIALGARKTITKPFRLRALLDTMTDLLDGDGAARTAC